MAAIVSRTAEGIGPRDRTHRLTAHGDWERLTVAAVLEEWFSDHGVGYDEYK